MSIIGISSYTEPAAAAMETQTSEDTSEGQVVSIWPSAVPYWPGFGLEASWFTME